MLPGIVDPSRYMRNPADNKWEQAGFAPDGIDSKIELIGTVLRTVMPSHATRVKQRRSFSPLRLLWWGSLLFSASGQRTDPFPSQFELSKINGLNGFVIYGEQTGDEIGRSISSAGDVNGDGLADLLIGAHHASPFGRTSAGKSYVIFGRIGLGSSGVLELSSLDGTNGFVLNGEKSYDRSGTAVSHAGDVNGDGLVDLLIGAIGGDPSGRTSAGKSYVVFGGVGLGGSGVLELTSLNGTQGFVINGDQVDDHSGYSVSSAGDVNGDGMVDLLIGAFEADPSGKADAGTTFVVFGGVDLGNSGVFELSSLNGTNGFILNGETVGDRSGWSVSSAGDVNGDGMADLLIGAYRASSLGRTEAGKTYVVYGGVDLGISGVLELSDIDGMTGVVLIGEEDNDNSGRSLSSVGDINGDGIDDFLIGANDASPQGKRSAGKAYVIFGRAGLGRNGILDLTSINGTNGFVLNGALAGDECGYSASSAGDVNGDGILDLVVGARNSAPSGRFDAGKTYVVYGGKDVGKSGVIELSTLNITTGFVLHGEQTGDRNGYSVSNAGDVNGDGAADFFTGARYATPSGRMQAGKTYVVFGRNVNYTQTSTPYMSTNFYTPSAPATSSQWSQTFQKSVIVSPTNPQQHTSAPKTSHQSFALSTTKSQSTAIIALSTSLSLTQAREAFSQVRTLTQTELLSHTPVVKMTSSDESSGNDIFIGIACSGLALFCSSVAGAMVAWCKLKKQNHEREYDIEMAESPLGADEKPQKIASKEKVNPQDEAIYGEFPSSERAPNEYDRVESPLVDMNYESVFSPLED